jgi:hypothetical protein
MKPDQSQPNISPEQLEILMRDFYHRRERSQDFIDGFITAQKLSGWLRPRCPNWIRTSCASFFRPLEPSRKRHR